LQIPSQESSPPSRTSATAFIPLPIALGHVVRILGPEPDKSATTVHPLIKLDVPLGAFQSYIAGICTPAGELVEPLELLLIDPEVYPDCDPIPLSVLFSQLDELPGLYDRLSATPGSEVSRLALGAATRLGPLLYCRKRHMVFVARSPDTLKPLTGLPAGDGTGSDDGSRLDPGLLAWDGPAAADQQARIYGASGGDCELGKYEPIEQLVRDQGMVATRAADMVRRDPVLFDELEREHACCTRDERELAKLSAGGYDFVLERLAVLSTGETPIMPLPLGEFSLCEAARIIGRTRPSEVVTGDGEGGNAFETWRGQRCEQIESSGSMLLLTGESDGRDLVEVCRLKLGLIEQVFSRLAETWSVSGRPHLCWNDHSIRVAWRPPPATSAACWGFQSIQRKIGLQPASEVRNQADETISYPPVFSDDSLLPPEAVEAARYFARNRSGNVFIKKSAPEGDNAVVLDILLEDTGIARRLFCGADVLHVSGDGWRAELAPMAEHNPDDGEGLPFAGTAKGNVGLLKADESLEGCGYTWYPRFGEAVDLHALGMLLFETLLAHDERGPERLREAITGERRELQNACAAVDEEQRNNEALAWIAGRCESDAPAAIWSRRNVIALRDDRAAVRLDAFPPLLWQSLITFGFRMITASAGFSFCPSRDHDVPRSQGGLVVPLLELRGLIAMFDDIIFGRAAAIRGLRGAVSGGTT
ncbi:MAG: hypothetical protein IID33_11865, partial [Planctomycetes bacterium]|nr:hypothetical protein [Planctomycetota bacterium]